MRNLINGAILVGILYMTGCSHGPWIVDIEKCDPGPSHIKLCHKVQELD